MEEGFTEDGKLWTLSRESTVHVAIQARAILNRIFSIDEEHCIFFFPFFLLIGLLFVKQVILITAHLGYHQRHCESYWPSKLCIAHCRYACFVCSFQDGPDYLSGILLVVIKVIICPM